MFFIICTVSGFENNENYKFYPNKQCVDMYSKVFGGDNNLLKEKNFFESINTENFPEYNKKYDKLSTKDNKKINSKNNEEYGIPFISHRIWLNENSVPNEDTLNRYIFFIKQTPYLRHFFWYLNNEKMKEMINFLKKDNLNIFFMNIEYMFSSNMFYGRTMFEDLYKNKFFTIASNILRFNIVYNYGGIYSDLGWILKDNVDLKIILNSCDVLLFPNDNEKIIDVWAFGFQKNSQYLYKFLDFINSLKYLETLQGSIKLNNAASYFSSYMFTVYMMFLWDNNIMKFGLDIFDIFRMDSWNKNTKFGNTCISNLESNFFSNLIKKNINIANVGCYGISNFGDDLFFEVLSRFLYPIHLEKISISNIEKFNIDDYKAILIGGGDLCNMGCTKINFFNDRFLKKPTFIVGVGVHQQEKKENYQHIKSFILNDSVKKIFLRDQKSTKLINDLISQEELNIENDIGKKQIEKCNVTSKKCLTKKAEYYPDIIWSLDLPYLISSDRKILAFVPRELGKVGYNINEEHINLLMKNIFVPFLSQDKNNELRIISLRKYVGESRMIESLIKPLIKTYTNLSFFEYDTPMRVIDRLKKVDTVLSLRFHGLIAGIMLGKPVLGINVSDKFDALSLQLQRSDIILNDFNDVTLEKLKTIKPIDFNCVNNIRDLSRIQLKELRHNASL